MNKSNSPIGFLDSGLGGLTVLKEALKIMPNEDYIYYGDSKNAPYGTKSVEDIKILTFKAVEFLLEKGVKGIVVACNTATSAAVAELRIKYPKLPLVGIEPAIKPAVENNHGGAIIMMATPMTVKQKKFNILLDKYRDRAKIIPVPCDGLMEFVESGVLEGKELNSYLQDKLGEYKSQSIDSIVLGCTHYPFVKQEIKNVIGENIDLIDGGYGTVREIQRRLSEQDLLNKSQDKGSVTIYNSSNDEALIKLSRELIYK